MRETIKSQFRNHFRNTSSRFGLVFFILATANLALGVVAMWPLIPEAPFWAKALFGFAIFGFLLAIGLSIYWLKKGSDDVTSEKLDKIIGKLEEKSNTTAIDPILGGAVFFIWLISKLVAGDKGQR